MRVHEVLARVPGLSRSTLAFWEKQGYISPQKFPAGHYFTRREYSEEDIKLIEARWKFRRQPRGAYQMALQQLNPKTREPELRPDKDVNQMPSLSTIKELVDSILTKRLRGIEGLFSTETPYKDKFVHYLNMATQGRY